MYVLAYVKNAEPPTEGFNLSNSSFPNVNGDYHAIVVDSIKREDYDDDSIYYTALVNYLINNHEIDSLSEIGEIVKPPYFNGTTYIIYGDLGTMVLPKQGNNSNNWYYYIGGGAQDLMDFEDWREDWKYNVSPGTTSNPQGSNDWTEHTFPTVTSYDDNPY